MMMRMRGLCRGLLELLYLLLGLMMMGRSCKTLLLDFMRVVGMFSFLLGLRVGWEGNGRYHAEPSGTFYRYDAKAIGSGSEGAQAELQNEYFKVRILSPCHYPPQHIPTCLSRYLIFPHSIFLSGIPELLEIPQLPGILLPFGLRTPCGIGTSLTI